MFDPAGHYRLSSRVGLRPEPFGALAYHFDTRRLVFLKSTDLVDLVRELDRHATVDDALDSVAPGRREPFVSALAALEESGVIEAAPAPPLEDVA